MPSLLSSSLPSPILNVVLYQPEIPQNTGNIGRTCVAIGAKLWMIRPLGFRLDDRYLKRAGMDYWQHLDWQVADSWEEVRGHLPDAQVWKLTKTATRLVWDATFAIGDILLFGSESRGLPASLLQLLPANNLKLPMSDRVRSLNLASTVNTVAYEAIRQLGGLPRIDADAAHAITAQASDGQQPGNCEQPVDCEQLVECQPARTSRQSVDAIAEPGDSKVELG